MSEPEPSRGAGQAASPLTKLWILLPAAAIWLYRRALSFAYFNDDPSGHFAWMEGRSLLDFFAGSADYGYYRPVVFTVLRLSEWLFGNETFTHNPVADHLLLLLLHGANVALLWALARRLSGRDTFAWVAALVFAFAPFHYEAVAYVASLTHPLLVCFALLTLLLYERGRRAGEQGAGHARAYRATALLAMSLGLLTHENGLFILPALVGVDWLTRPDAALMARARRLWPYAVPPALFIALWLLVPKNSEQGLNGLAEIGRNAVPFLQTLIYPLLPLARLDAADVWLLALLAAAFVALTGWLAWRIAAARLWAFALGWFALSSLPALLFLGPAYVYGSPRLSYLPAIGVALLWAIPALWLVESLPRIWSGSSASRPATFILTALYALAIILPPRPFIHCQLDFYDETSRFARGMAAAGAAASAGREIVFVNAPFFFSSTADRPDGCTSPYPWTPVGGVLIPPYAQPRDFVRFNGGPDRAAAGVAYPGYMPGWQTFGPEIGGETLRAHVIEDAPYVFDLLDGSFTNLAAVWRPDAGEAARSLATFGDVLTLDTGDFEQADGRLAVRLDWRVLAAGETPLAAFVHVYDANGMLAAQSDSPPGGRFAPQHLWQRHDGLLDERVIDLSAVPPGAYRVTVGVYEAAGGARLAAEADGRPLPDNVFPLGEFTR